MSIFQKIFLHQFSIVAMHGTLVSMKILSPSFSDVAFVRALVHCTHPSCSRDLNSKFLNFSQTSSSTNVQNLKSSITINVYWIDDFEIICSAGVPYSCLADVTIHLFFLESLCSLWDKIGLSHFLLSHVSFSVKTTDSD